MEKVDANEVASYIETLNLHLKDGQIHDDEVVGAIARVVTFLFPYPFNIAGSPNN